MFLDTALLTPVIVCIIFFSLLFIVFSSSSLLVFGYSESIIQETKTPILSQTSRDDQHQQQQPNKVIEASGHFANNQIENGTVTWIQGGLWNLEIYNSTTNNSSNGTLV